MLKECTSFRQIYIACGRTDLRKGIDGLATLVTQRFHLDPFQKDVLFLFCGCRQDRFKGLVWEGDGFVLIYKRIEAGRLQWPRTEEDVAAITFEELQSLLSGFAILQKSTIQVPSCTQVA